MGVFFFLHSQVTRVKEKNTLPFLPRIQVSGLDCRVWRQLGGGSRRAHPVGLREAERAVGSSPHPAPASFLRGCSRGGPGFRIHVAVPSFCTSSSLPSHGCPWETSAHALTPPDIEGAPSMVPPVSHCDTLCFCSAPPCLGGTCAWAGQAPPTPRVTCKGTVGRMARTPSRL